MHQPITMADADELGVPACFSEEYAYYERNGMPLPCGGPVYPDYGSDAYDPFGDEPWPESDYPPAPPPPVSLVKPHLCNDYHCCPPF